MTVHAYVVAQLGPVCGTRHSAAIIYVPRLLDPMADAYGPCPRQVGCGIRPPTTHARNPYDWWPMGWLTELRKRPGLRPVALPH